ncbi:hypothetical protein Tco_0180643 [Tanacetum coccineum]
MESLIHKYSLQHLPELTKKLTPRAEQEYEKSPSEILKIKTGAPGKKYDLKSALYQSMHGNKSFNRNPINHRLYHELMEVLIEDENAMDTGVADTVKDHKRKHDDDDEDDKDPPAGPNQVCSAKEPVEEPIAEVIMDDAGDDLVRDDDQPQAASKPKTSKTLNPEWFKQPPRPPTPDPEWNKRQVVLDQPAQPWFNQMVSASKDPLTFNDLMATPIDFSKYVLNGLKIENLTQDILLGPAFNLLKGTCSSRDRYPFDLSKPLPLQGPPGHRTVAADYFFNNDLEYLKTSDPVVTYTTSITKTEAAQYEIKGIEYMVSKFSKQNVYSTKAILGVKSVSVKTFHRYGHLEEIVVKRFNQQLYKFKEGDFVDLHLNDIEDMLLLLVVQHKLFHLDESDIIDFILALRMFTRSRILKRRIEDLHLGVESYQKKLNIAKPHKIFLEIEFKEPYTPLYDPPGIIYKDLDK